MKPGQIRWLTDGSKVRLLTEGPDEGWWRVEIIAADDVGDSHDQTTVYVEDLLHDPACDCIDCSINDGPTH